MTVAASPEEEPNKGANYDFSVPGIQMTVNGIGPGCFGGIVGQNGLSGVTAGGVTVPNGGSLGGFIDWPQQPYVLPYTVPQHPGGVFPPPPPQIIPPPGTVHPTPILDPIPDNVIRPGDSKPSFYDDLMVAIERQKKVVREEKERMEKMERDGVYKISLHEVDDAMHADRVPFREAVVNMVIAMYAAVAAIVVGPAKVVMAVLKLPVKGAQLVVRAVKHTTLVMLPPSLLALSVVGTIFGPRWIKWCCDVGGWPYYPPGENSDWFGFAVLSGLAIIATLVCTIAHFVSRITEGKWWWPDPKKD